VQPETAATINRSQDFFRNIFSVFSGQAILLHSLPFFCVSLTFPLAHCDGEQKTKFPIFQRNLGREFSLLRKVAISFKNTCFGVSFFITLLLWSNKFDLPPSRQPISKTIKANIKFTNDFKLFRQL
jgi:hypothetical protein